MLVLAHAPGVLLVDAVRRVYFQVAGSEAFSGRELVTTLNWTEGLSGALSCVSEGGYPPPSINIHVDSVDISRQFSLSYSATLDGVKGLRVITYISERYDTRAHTHTHARRILHSASLLRLSVRPSVCPSVGLS